MAQVQTVTWAEAEVPVRSSGWSELGIRLILSHHLGVTIPWISFTVCSTSNMQSQLILEWRQNCSLDHPYPHLTH